LRRRWNVLITQADQSAEERARGVPRRKHHADILERADALLVESEKPIADLVRDLVRLLRLERDLRVHAQLVRRATKISSPG